MVKLILRPIGAEQTPGPLVSQLAARFRRYANRPTFQREPLKTIADLTPSQIENLKAAGTSRRHAPAATSKDTVIKATPKRARKKRLRQHRSRGVYASPKIGYVLFDPETATIKTGISVNPAQILSAAKHRCGQAVQLLLTSLIRAYRHSRFAELMPNRAAWVPYTDEIYSAILELQIHPDVTIHVKTGIPVPQSARRQSSKQPS